VRPQRSVVTPQWRTQITPHTAARLARPPSRRGYYWQLLSPLGWSSLPFLWLVSQRTAVICGDNELAVPVVNAWVLSTLIRGAELTVVAGGGHLVGFERPEAVATSVAEFLGGSAEIPNPRCPVILTSSGSGGGVRAIWR
jgi:pimeloyl-ACP methyl ester carboxylesterase